MSNERNGSASANGHDAKGRFAKGNAGGPGNPFGRKLAANRAAILEAVTPEDVRLIMGVLREKALAGDLAAAKLVLQYAVGKPQPVPQPDRVNIEEWEIAAEERVPHAEAMIAHLDMPVEKAVEFATGLPHAEVGPEPTARTKGGTQAAAAVEEEEVPEIDPNDPEYQEFIQELVMRGLASFEAEPGATPIASFSDGSRQGKAAVCAAS